MQHASFRFHDAPLFQAGKVRGTRNPGIIAQPGNNCESVHQWIDWRRFVDNSLILFYFRASNLSIDVQLPDFQIVRFFHAVAVAFRQIMNWHIEQFRVLSVP
jgi:hypothetical protein